MSSGGRGDKEYGVRDTTVDDKAPPPRWQQEKRETGERYTRPFTRVTVCTCCHLAFLSLFMVHLSCLGLRVLSVGYFTKYRGLERS